MFHIPNHLIKTLNLGTKYLLNEPNNVLCSEKEMMATLKHISVTALKEQSQTLNKHREKSFSGLQNNSNPNTVYLRVGKWKEEITYD